MAANFEFLTPEDRPALVALSTPELLETAKTSLEQLGYKTHFADTHGEFLHKFAQVPYHVVILEELFAARTPEENESLLTLQRMPMNQRRHATSILFGFSFATLNPLQAFQYGVHAVINPSEMFLLVQLIQKTVSENDMFLHIYRDVQKRAG